MRISGVAGKSRNFKWKYLLLAYILLTVNQYNTFQAFIYQSLNFLHLKENVWRFWHKWPTNSQKRHLRDIGHNIRLIRNTLSSKYLISNYVSFKIRTTWPIFTHKINIIYFHVFVLNIHVCTLRTYHTIALSPLFSWYLGIIFQLITHWITTWYCIIYK